MPVVPPTDASAAERVRSVLTAAGSLDLVTTSGRARLIGRHTVTDNGQLTLHLPGDSRTAEEVTHAAGDVPVVVELTDIAPVAVRGRVRAQVSLNGVAAVTGRRHGADADPAGTVVVVVRVACAQLIEGATYTLVTADELAQAPADPLAAAEAAWLIHLVNAHPDVVDLLTRLVPPRDLDGVCQVRPLRLDRFGIVLRLQRLRAYHDVRLAFPVPLGCRDDAGAHFRALVDQARVCRGRPRRPLPG